MVSSLITLSKLDLTPEYYLKKGLLPQSVQKLNLDFLKINLFTKEANKLWLTLHLKQYLNLTTLKITFAYTDILFSNILSHLLLLETGNLEHFGKITFHAY